MQLALKPAGRITQGPTEPECADGVGSLPSPQEFEEVMVDEEPFPSYPDVGQGPRTDECVEPFDGSRPRDLASSHHGRYPGVRLL